MNLFDAIFNQVQSLRANDLLSFFNVEEIETRYRSNLTKLDTELELIRHDFHIQQTKETWTLFGTPNKDNEGLFLYNHSQKIMFVNHTFISNLLLETLREMMNLKGILLVRGLVNNSKVKKLEGIEIKSSYSLSSFIHEIIYGQAIEEYNHLHKARLLAVGEGRFSELPIAKQREIMEKVESEALNRFISNQEPAPFRFELQTPSRFIVNGLVLSSIEKMFQALENKEALAMKLEDCPIIDELNFDFQFKRHLKVKYYFDHYQEWFSHPTYRAAREISLLRQAGALHDKGKTVIDSIEVDLILKGKSKRIKGWIRHSHKGACYFQPKEYSSMSERIPFTEVSKIYVDGEEIFCFKAFKEQLATEKDLKQILTSQVETSPEAKAELVEVKDSISQKNEIIERQMALNLF